MLPDFLWSLPDGPEASQVRHIVQRGSAGWFNVLLSNCRLPTFAIYDGVPGHVLTFHSPSQRPSSPVESITRCAISPQVNCFETALTGFARLLTLGVIRAAQPERSSGQNGINKTLRSPRDQPGIRV